MKTPLISTVTALSLITALAAVSIAAMATGSSLSAGNGSSYLRIEPAAGVGVQ